MSKKCSKLLDGYSNIALTKSFSHKFASFLYEERQYKKAADYYKEALEIDLGEGGMV